LSGAWFVDKDFWLERWQKQETGFHQTDVHDLLQTHWAALGAAPASPVLVPLCGKSLDMAWLAAQGHRVIGVELSELAVDDFFVERGLEAETKTVGRFIVKSAGAYEIWCGDIFDLPQAAVAGVAAVYDRAALIAFPASMQHRYADTIKSLAPNAVPVLLITLDYDQTQMAGPPFATPRQQVDRLFADRYDVGEIARREVLDKNPHFRQRGLTALSEGAYLLRPL
jgi:thiopurine S-methyltransferase